MATIRIPSESRLLTDTDEVVSYLTEAGIWHERWPVAGRLEDHFSQDQILAAYAREIEVLKARGGYVTADVINVTPDLPGLQAMLDKFNKEHTHAEDEVRFIVKGSGVFHIHPVGGAVFAIEVGPGDLINVPAGTRHWFDLCVERTICAIRLFRESAGWTPLYTDSEIANGYAPLCLGPSYMRGHPLRLDQPALPVA